jgi:hypothetical protein
MAHDDDRPLGAEERAALDAWTAPEVPAGFADRVIAAMAPAQAAPVRTGRWAGAKWVVIGAAAAAAVLVWQLRGGTGRATATGSAAPSVRQTLAVGGRATAVAEPGANLSWSVDGSGAAVAQSAGDVFYRVERGGPFRVETPHGTVLVTGTCFRVETRGELDMKRPWREIAAAGVGAALVVTVYEGSVLFAGKDGGKEPVVAGQVLAAGPGGEGAVVREVDGEGIVAADMPAAPGESASREELFQRDQVQRAEIASLRARVRQLESGGGPGRDPHAARDASGRPWFDPSKEDLVKFAAECRVRYDLPPVMGTEPKPIGPRMAKDLGIAPEETGAVNKVLAEIHRFYVAELRKLYVEVTGDAARADDLSPEAMGHELEDKSPPGEASRVNQRIARERAGMDQPPANLASLPAIERFMRLRAGLGDRTEQDLAAVVGAERARTMREENGGWGMRQEVAGCADGSGEGEVEVER